MLSNILRNDSTLVSIHFGPCEKINKQLEALTQCWKLQVENYAIYLHWRLDDELQPTDTRIIPTSKEIIKIKLKCKYSKCNVEPETICSFFVPLHKHSNVPKLLNWSKLVECCLFCNESKKLKFYIHLEIILMDLKYWQDLMSELQ